MMMLEDIQWYEPVIAFKYLDAIAPFDYKLDEYPWISREYFTNAVFAKNRCSQVNNITH